MQKEIRISDLTKLLDVSPQAVRSYIKKGYFPAHKKGKHVYIYLEDYMQFLCDYPFFRRKFYAAFDKLPEKHESYDLALEIHRHIMCKRVFFAIQDVADICDVTVQAIHNWIARGELRKDVDGKFFSVTELKRFFAAHPSITRWQKIAI